MCVAHANKLPKNRFGKRVGHRGGGHPTSRHDRTRLPGQGSVPPSTTIIDLPKHVFQKGSSFSHRNGHGNGNWQGLNAAKYWGEKIKGEEKK